MSAKEMKFFYEANSLAKNIQNISKVIFGEENPEGGILFDMDLSVWGMVEYILAGMKDGEEPDSDNTIKATLEILHATSEEKINETVLRYKNGVL